MQSKMNSHSLLVGMQNGTAISEDIWPFLTKLSMLLLYDPAITLLVWDLPKWVETCDFTEGYTWMFIAAWFIITKAGSNQDALQ